MQRPQGLSARCWAAETSASWPRLLPLRCRRGIQPGQRVIRFLHAALIPVRHARRPACGCAPSTTGSTRPGRRRPLPRTWRRSRIFQPVGRKRILIVAHQRRAHRQTTHIGHPVIFGGWLLGHRFSGRQTDHLGHPDLPVGSARNAPPIVPGIGLDGVATVDPQCHLVGGLRAQFGEAVADRFQRCLVGQGVGGGVSSGITVPASRSRETTKQSCLPCALPASSGAVPGFRKGRLLVPSRRGSARRRRAWPPGRPVPAGPSPGSARRFARLLRWLVSLEWRHIQEFSRWSRATAHFTVLVANPGSAARP